MPVLSLYSFETATVPDGGPFRETHVATGRDGFGSGRIENIATCGISLPAQAGSVLALVRPDDEDVLDLTQMYNNFGVTGLPSVMNNQPPSVTARDLAVSLIGSDGTVLGLRSTPLNRWFVPSNISIPAPANNQVLTEMHIDFRIDTREGCYSHTGTITIYVQFLLQPGQVRAARGLLRASPIGMTYTRDTNPDGCAGSVNDSLDGLCDPPTQALLIYYFRYAVGQFLQSIVDQRPPTEGPNPPTHARIYGLPGDGKRSGSGSGTMDADFSIGLERTGSLEARFKPLHWPWR